MSVQIKSRKCAPLSARDFYSCLVKIRQNREVKECFTALLWSAKRAVACKYSRWLRFKPTLAVILNEGRSPKSKPVGRAFTLGSRGSISFFGVAYKPDEFGGKFCFLRLFFEGKSLRIKQKRVCQKQTLFYTFRISNYIPNFAGLTFTPGPIVEATTQLLTY